MNRSARMTLLLHGIGAALLAACGGSTSSAVSDGGAPDSGVADSRAPEPDGGAIDAGPDVDNGAPSETYPAPHPPLPQVKNLGGPVLQHPKVVGVYFPNDAYKTRLDDYLDKLGATPYWQANTTEYGVGALARGPSFELTEAAPATIESEALATWLTAKLEAGAFGAPDTSTVYTVFYPSTTTIQFGPNGQYGESCKSFGGYHDELTLRGGTSIAYAVIPRCPNFHTLAEFDMVTVAVSHELIEAATDPHPQSEPAYADINDEGTGWAFAATGGAAEVGDMCSSNAGVYYKPAGFDYMVQRSWSNAAAKASHDPCAPSVGPVYFNAAPVASDTVIAHFGQYKLPVSGAKIALGQSRTLDVVLFSDAKTSGAFEVSARNMSRSSGAPALTFAFDRTQGVNGEKLHLTITVNRDADGYGVQPFVLESKLGGVTNRFWAVVGQ